MKYLTSNEIRNMFLNYFKGKGHDIIPSASLVPHDDPTLLWNNAGVTPLKKYFDGTIVPDNKRMVSCQKCIRTNDIESVGDATHHTFFEMLGNFSIGDYFKKEAISMSYELLTSDSYFGFPKDKLYVTVYPSDEEAKEYWLNVGMPLDHIVELKDNFWCIGEGPCGPDSEIFFDRGEKYDKDNLGIRLLKEDIPNSRYVEIWNNVFSQYNAKEGLERDKYPELPNKNIDTGMGLERMTLIIQEKESNYDTDLFMPIIKGIENITGIKYNDNSDFRIIADHIRTLTFAISDGAVFSNEGRGYVLRRLLRRAYRCGKKLGLDKPFLFNLVDVVVYIMSSAYPYLEEKKEDIKRLVLKEEELFSNTLVSGEKRLFEMIDNSKDKTISGADAFKLYDTYGFPFELTLEYLNEKGYSVSKSEFNEYMNNQREMARNARKNEASMNIQNAALLSFLDKSTFVGYEKHECETKVIGLFIGDKSVNELDNEGYVILESTPFYAEMGGQVADNGYIYNDNVKLEVIDVIKAPNKQHLHIVNVVEGKVSLNDVVTAKINSRRRESIEKNHSATHLLQEALKETLNDTVAQAGSRVDEYTTRFDFNYPNEINETDILMAEKLVNEKISTGVDSITEEMELSKAKESGAVALFSEKYDNIVRVVTLLDSKELCGGTHVKNVKDISKFAIKSFSSIGANTFRIEAATNNNIASELYKSIKPYNDEMIKLLEKAKKIMNDAKNNDIELEFFINVDNSEPTSYEDIIYNRRELEHVKEKVKGLEKELETKKQEKALDNITIFESSIVDSNIKYLIIKVENYEMSILKSIVDRLLEKMESGFIFIANVNSNNVNFISKCSKDLINKLNCGSIIKDASSRSNGNGGGSDIFGQGGGTNIDNLDQIIDDITSLVKNVQ